MAEKSLRTGFTTGASSAAAARACMLALRDKKATESVNVRLPRGGEIKINIESCEFSDTHAKCTVIKDGGDDPDVTHGAQITVECKPGEKPGDIQILGGEGVGTVTKPGLGLEIGTHAINPVPKKMITYEVLDAGKSFINDRGVIVTISVRDGQKLAMKTDNPRLGIIGGISILGTSGIVVPFSTAAFAASVRQAISVAMASGNVDIILTTGGRSEEYAKQVATKLPDVCYVQMGDFAGYAISQCAKTGIKSAHIFGFIGKLAKIAGGAKQTHVKGSKVNTELLAQIASECGADTDTQNAIKKANTARHAGQIATERNVKGFFEGIAKRAHKQMDDHCDSSVNIKVTMLGFEGGMIAMWPPQ